MMLITFDDCDRLTFNVEKGYWLTRTPQQRLTAMMYLNYLYFGHSAIQQPMDRTAFQVISLHDDNESTD